MTYTPYDPAAMRAITLVIGETVPAPEPLLGQVRDSADVWRLDVMTPDAAARHLERWAKRIREAAAAAA